MAKQSSYLLEETSIIRKQDMLQLLENLGIQKGMLLLVNVNTFHLGHLLGGPQMLVEALMEAVGYDGTIVVPAFTPQLLDPACQKNSLPRQYWEDSRQQIYPFDKKLSEPYGSDPFIYQFLRNDGVARSYHPLYSFAAWGKYAKLICDKHPLHFALGKDSPLGKVYDLAGCCVLLGCGYKECTMFHMAAYDNEQSPIRVIAAPIEDREKKWKRMLDIRMDPTCFSEIGKIMEERGIVNSMHIGNDRCSFFTAKEAVHIAAAHFHSIW